MSADAFGQPIDGLTRSLHCHHGLSTFVCYRKLKKDTPQRSAAPVETAS
jgi:hypothetical protein